MASARGAALGLALAEMKADEAGGARNQNRDQSPVRLVFLSIPPQTRVGSGVVLAALRDAAGKV
jgi:hypothetical protein